MVDEGSPAAGPPERRPTGDAAPNKKFTPEVRDRFLANYRKLKFVVRAAESVGLTKATVYLERRSNPEFAEAMDAVRESICEDAEAEAWRRGVDGHVQVVIRGGEIVYHRVPVEGADPSLPEAERTRLVPLTERVFSDKLLELVLRANLPDKYGNKVRVDATVQTGVMLVPPESSDEDFERALAEERERRLVEDKSGEP